MHATTRAEAAPEIPIQLPGSSLAHGTVISKTILDDVRSAAIDGLFKLKSVGLETGGVLFGRICDGALIVTRAVRFDPQYAFGPSWRLSDADLERFRDVTPATQRADEVAVGYFVSHTRMEPVLSEHNVALFDAVFPDACNIVLVVKPHVFLPMRCVVHYRSSAGELVSSAEFLYDESAPDQEPVAEEVGIADAGSDALVSGDEPIPPRRAALVWTAAGIALAALVVMGAGLLWSRSPRSVATRVPDAVRAAAVVPAYTAAPPPAKPRTDPPPAAPKPDEKRVKQLQEELDRLKDELAQQSTPKTGVESNRAPARKFMPPQAKAPGSGAADRSVPPSRLELEQPPAIAAAPPTTRLPGLAVPASSPPPTAPVAAPAAPGRLLWTGSLRKGALLFIENSRASTGNLTGPLPGRPVRIVVEPASLTDGGMVVHTADKGRAARSESPGAENGWNATAFAYDPKQAQDVTVIEAPTAQNQWRKLVLRANRPVSVVMISWH